MLTFEQKREAEDCLNDAIRECNVPFDIAKDWITVFLILAPFDGIGDETVSGAMKLTGRLIRKHFSDHSGDPDQEDKKAFLRELFAAANRVINGEPLEA